MQTVSPNPIALSRALDAIDASWYTWEPEAIHQAAQEAGFDADSAVVENMLGALSVLRDRPEAFWAEWEVFENVAQAFCGNVPSFSHVQPPSPAEAAFAVHVARALSPGRMSYEVSSYIEAILHSHGLSFGVMDLDGIVDRSSKKARRREVHERYAALLEQDDPAIGESATDIEALKLLAIRSYVLSNQVTN